MITFLKIIFLPVVALYELPRLYYYYRQYKKELNKRAAKVTKKYGMAAGAYFYRATNFSFWQFLTIIGTTGKNKKPKVKIIGRQK